MNNLPKEKPKHIQILESVEIDINEISKKLDVTPRQLRYWEEKGYIKSQTTKNHLRRYNIAMAKRIATINFLYKQGYTLARASELANFNENKLKLLFKMIHYFEVNDRVEIDEGKPLSGKILLGKLDDGKEIELQIIGNDIKLQVKKD
ncbi:MAG: MerR family transcriptional regulator [Lactobacillus sp.]|nr:MerR family transcriptional regulator [Lactobacillus sp.]